MFLVNGVLSPRPLFRVDLEPNALNPEIYNLTNLLQVRITVEAFKPKSDPPLCRNCQRFGHTKSYCLRSPRCIKCAENHSSDKCVLAASAPCKCVNCGGQHPASYRGCPAFQKLRREPHKAVNEINKRKSQVEKVSTPTVVTSQPPTPSSHPTYASITHQSSPPMQRLPPDPLLLLMQLTSQVSLLTERMQSIEQMLVTPPTATPVHSTPSRSLKSLQQHG